MSLGYIGKVLAICISAMGSAIGIGLAAVSAVGAWKKCYGNGKPAPFMLVAFTGAPLTQTIYGFLVNQFINSALLGNAEKSVPPADPLACLFIGAFAGLAIGLSALFQGKCAAAACDSLGETGKGTANYLIVIGIIETVALFAMVFSMLVLGNIPA